MVLSKIKYKRREHSYSDAVGKHVRMRIVAWQEENVTDDCEILKMNIDYGSIERLYAINKYKTTHNLNLVLLVKYLNSYDTRDMRT